VAQRRVANYGGSAEGEGRLLPSTRRCRLRETPKSLTGREIDACGDSRVSRIMAKRLDPITVSSIVGAEATEPSTSGIRLETQKNTGPTCYLRTRLRDRASGPDRNVFQSFGFARDSSTEEQDVQLLGG
jgi:hypothetical protein